MFLFILPISILTIQYITHRLNDGFKGKTALLEKASVLSSIFPEPGFWYPYLKSSEIRSNFLALHLRQELNTAFQIATCQVHSDELTISCIVYFNVLQDHVPQHLLSKFTSEGVVGFQQTVTFGSCVTC